MSIRISAFTAKLEQLGPGLITGAADNDPSGIATYSQTGAQFGYCRHALPMMHLVPDRHNFVFKEKPHGQPSQDSRHRR